MTWRRATGEIVAAAALLAVFHSIGQTQLNGWALDLGSTNGPTPWFGRFLGMWAIFGGASAFVLALGLWRLLSATDGERRLREAWRQVPDGRWIAYVSLAAFALPAMLRVHLLLGMPLMDDENAYRFAAQILAGGRLYLESPPMKLFFDNSFLVNDGKLYTQYFLGWPALMAPGVWLGIPGLMNAVYSALTVPALFAVVRRLAGSSWAKAATALYLASPMLMVGAATQTSHPTCLMALAWLTWFFLRSRDADAPWWTHGGVALSFAAAFFIRPTSALGIALPLLVAWLLGLRRMSAAARLRALVAFAVPAGLTAALFFYVNHAQNGSWLGVAYQRYYEYSKANGFRFSIWQEELDLAVRNFAFGTPWTALGILGIALFRFNFAFLGWPSSLLFLPLARGPAARLFWCGVLCFVAVHFFTNSVGVDTFAPMHYYELALPALVLTVLGLRRLHTMLLRWSRTGAVPHASRALAPLLAVALVAVTAVGYVPVRFTAIHQVAKAIHTPHAALEEAGIERGVIFAPAPFIDRCKYYPAVAFLFSRPNNDPELENDVLWVNHLSIPRNKELMAEHFPDRQGWVMRWLNDCRVAFLPLDQLPMDSVPPSRYANVSPVAP